jgi:hypothetical protein
MKTTTKQQLPTMQQNFNILTTKANKLAIRVNTSTTKHKERREEEEMRRKCYHERH